MLQSVEFDDDCILPVLLSEKHGLFPWDLTMTAWRKEDLGMACGKVTEAVLVGAIVGGVSIRELSIQHESLRAEVFRSGR